MKKIIISAVSIALILAIGITTLVLALIPTGFNDTIEKPYAIYIMNSQTSEYHNGVLSFKEREDDQEARDVISNIYSLLCHSFEQKTLNAIFNKELNESLKTNYSSTSKNISKNSSSEEKITIVFQYKNSKKIKAVNNSKEYSYNYLFFEISGKNERDVATFAVRSDLTLDNSSYQYNYSFSGKANFSRLYEYASSLI